LEELTALPRKGGRGGRGQKGKERRVYGREGREREGKDGEERANCPKYKSWSRAWIQVKGGAWIKAGRLMTAQPTNLVSNMNTLHSSSVPCHSNSD